MRKIFLSVLFVSMTAGTFAQVTNRSKAADCSRPTVENTYVLTQSHNRLQKAPVQKAGIASQYGEEVPVMSEDFSLVTTGSLESPDVSNPMWNGREVTDYVYMNMKPKYVHGDGVWGGEGIYPGGGCVVCNANGDGGGRINTPMIDLSGYNRVAVLRFKARTLGGTFDGLEVAGAETNQMGPSWEYLENYICPTVTEEWQEYEMLFTNCGPSTIFNIGYWADDMQICIDDISVSQIDMVVDIPEVKSFSEYTGDSFVANWEAVPEAESYLVDVYSARTESWRVEFEPVKTDLAATGNSLVVDGLEPGTVYRYTVRAVKGDHTSLPSLPADVCALTAPELEDVAESDMTADGYTARWSEVAGAERYNYWAFHKRAAEKDGEFLITDENYDGILNADGNAPDESKDAPTYYVYGEGALLGVQQPGWMGYNYRPCMEGCLYVDAYHYLYNNENAAIVSPEMDFSKDGGKVTLTATLAAEEATYWGADGNEYRGFTQAAFALFNYDEEKGDYVQADLVYADGTTEAKDGVVGSDWQTYTVTLNGASARSKVGVFAVRYPGCLFIDDLKVAQEYKAGEILEEPCVFARYAEKTTYDVVLPAGMAGQEITHKVNAVRTNPIDYSLVESDFSETKVINLATGVKGVSISEKASVSLSGNVLSIVNPNGSEVSVYTVDGKLVGADKSGKVNTAITLPAQGAYIVKMGKDTVKVVF